MKKLIVEISTQTHKDLKLQALELDITLQKLVIALLDD